MNKKIFWISFFTLICALGLIRGLWVGVSEDAGRIYDDDLYILINDEAFFPQNILAQIEYKLNSHIHLKKYRSLGELEQILVADANYGLIFGPRQTLTTLNNQNFLENINTQINKYITQDFINFNINNLSYFFPVFWNFYIYVDGTSKNQTSPSKSTDKFVNKYTDKYTEKYTDKWLVMPDDLDFIYTLLKEKSATPINQENPFELAEKFKLKILNSKLKNIPPAAATDSSYSSHINIPDEKELYINATESIYLKEYGFSIIRERQARALSYAFIQDYINKKYQKELIENLKIASTLEIAEKLKIENRQKPSFIRKKIPLTKLHRIEKSPIEWEEIYNN